MYVEVFDSCFRRKLAEMDIFITWEEIDNYKEAFLEYDADGSGNISIAGKN